MHQVVTLNCTVIIIGEVLTNILVLLQLDCIFIHITRANIIAHLKKYMNTIIMYPLPSINFHTTSNYHIHYNYLQPMRGHTVINYSHSR